MAIDWNIAVPILALLVALGACIAAWRAPRAAARFADELRRRTQDAESKQQMRFAVFTALMRCRSQLLHNDAVTALNLIDVAFMDDEPVRDAYRSFREATLEAEFSPIRLVERYHVIIERIATALGYAGKISSFDVRGGYYPAAYDKLDEAAFAEAEEKIARRAAREAAGLLE